MALGDDANFNIAIFIQTWCCFFETLNIAMDTRKGRLARHAGI
jgi:hypothetical protein